MSKRCKKKERQVRTYRNTGVSLQGHRQETERVYCRNDPGNAGIGESMQDPPLWACLLLPWQWSEAGSAAGFLQGPVPGGTPNTADHCRLRAEP